MAWYRLAWTKLDKNVMKEMYDNNETLPLCVAIETDDCAAVLQNSSCNVILYLDLEMTDEKNDFFFQTVDQGKAFMKETYSIAYTDWKDINPPLVL